MVFTHLRRFLKREGLIYKKEGKTYFQKARNLLEIKEGKKKEIYLPLLLVKFCDTTAGIEIMMGRLRFDDAGRRTDRQT